MDNNNMFKDSDLTINAQNSYGGIKSHIDGELHTLIEMLVRIERLEETISDMKYFLNNPRKLD